MRGNTLTRTPACLAMRMSSSVSAAPASVGAMIARWTSWSSTSARKASARCRLDVVQRECGSSAATTSAFSRPAAILSRIATMLACSPTTRQRSVADIRRANQRAATRPQSRRPTVAAHSRITLAARTLMSATPSMTSQSTSVCSAAIWASAGASSSVVFFNTSSSRSYSPTALCRSTTKGTRTSATARGVPSIISGRTATTSSTATIASAHARVRR